MASLLRTSLRVPRARFFTPAYVTSPRRYASSDYGSVDSGHKHDAADNQNPRRDLEHPGPETPASQDGSSSSSGSTPKSASDGSASASSTSDGSKPTIQTPESSKEKEGSDVKQHNDDMAQRNDRSDNQSADKDNKVNKKFWKGDVGDADQKS